MLLFKFLLRFYGEEEHFRHCIPTSNNSMLYKKKTGFENKKKCIYLKSPVKLCKLSLLLREGSGSVVGCLTPDQGVAGLSLTSITAFLLLSKTH